MENKKQFKHKVSLSGGCSARLEEEMEKTGFTRSRIIEESLKQYFSEGNQTKNYIRPETKILLCRKVCKITEGVNIIKRGEIEQGVKQIEEEIDGLCQIL